MDTKQREKKFHNEIWDNNARGVTDKFYTITRTSRQYYLDSLRLFGANREALEYGCGPGSSAIALAKHGATVTGIDISEVAIASARETCARLNFDIRFEVMDAERLTFADDSFDLVCGTGILHHLRLDRACPELARVLVPGGKAIFLEPLGHNPLINYYRNRTPHLRTPDEHPLLLDDLKMLEAYFCNVDIRFFHLSSLLATPFHSATFFLTLLRCFDRIDRFLFRCLPYLKRHAWTAALVMEKPKA